MSDKPILFSGPMVRALLAGTKTQTRREIKPRPWNAEGDCVNIDAAKSADYGIGSDGRAYFQFEHPLGGPLTAYVSRIAVGDKLYVREAWAGASSDAGPVICYRANFDRWQPDYTGPNEGAGPSFDYDRYATDYSRWAADLEAADKGWKPGIHMPRWASRLTLTVTDVRVERLQDITNEDCLAEGIPDVHNPHVPKTGPIIDDFARKHGLISHYGAEYMRIWEAINGKGSWAKNPWVAAYSFTVQRGNIDQLAGAA